MGTRRPLALLLLLQPGLAPTVCLAQRFSTNNTLSQTNSWDESHARAWILWYLDSGMPGYTDTLHSFTIGRSALAVPLIEAKMEQVLKSPAPGDCFTDKSVDVSRFLAAAGVTIAGAGDAEAMKALDKLTRIDEKQFGGLVEMTLSAAYGRPKVVAVAYAGLDLANPAMRPHITNWIEERLSDKSPTAVALFKKWWAQALLDRYSVVPTEAQWANDPIASQLQVSRRTAIRDEMLRLCTQILESGPK